jgi:DNA polymerase III delta subunit
MAVRQAKEKKVEFSTVLSQIEEGTIAPVYFLYGEDSVALNQAKRKLINLIIPPEYRDGNLNEFVGKGLDIMECITLSDTYPFLATRRVIVIENYPYLSGTKKLPAKATAELDRFAEYITSQQATWTTLIFVFEEDKEKGRTVSKTNHLYSAIKKHGIIVEFAFSDSMFKFLDTLGARDSGAALRYLHQFFHSEVEQKEPTAIHRMITRSVRFWLEALLMTSTGSESDLPSSTALNITQQIPFVRSKIERQARQFAKKELMIAIADLVTLEDKLNPRATDLLAENPELALESWIIKFCKNNKN